MEMDKLHFLSYAAEAGFLQFKGRGPYKFHRLVLLLALLSFCWTVPLKQDNVTVRYHSGGSMKLNAHILLLAHMVYL